jgi:NTE family protein
MQPVNLVLSGGGVRGVAHLGAVKALQEHGVVLEAISGVSSGALVGAFLAAGYLPDEVLEIIRQHSLMSLLRPGWNDGLLSMKKLETVLKGYFPDDAFERLNIPLIVSCSDLTEGHTDYFSRGNMIRPILASCSIPVLFQPVEIEGDQLVDGGVINNLPVEPFQEDAITLVGINVNPWKTGVKVDSLASVMERSIALCAWHTVKSRRRFCDVFIEPQELEDFGVFETGRLDELYRIGYEAASRTWELKSNTRHHHEL